jgi:aspartate dehydrogenase
MVDQKEIQKRRAVADPIDKNDGVVVVVEESSSSAKYKRRKRDPLKIGLLGCGAINSTVAKMIANQEAGPAILKAILVRNERSKEEIQSLLPTSDTDAGECFTTDPDKFFAKDSDWDLCIEAAGQPAVRQYGKRCLEMGRDLMITSIGALTDDALYEDLSSTAEASGARLILCTGSMPALDWMGSAALDHCAEVKVTQIKPPRAWLGTPAEDAHPDLLTMKAGEDKPRVLFEGSARDAASAFPKNANTAAMLALATAGLDDTRASLVADPSATSNRVELSFRGTAGNLQVQVEAAPSKTNPRTSAIVALSVVKAIRKLCCTVVVGL